MLIWITAGYRFFFAARKKHVFSLIFVKNEENKQEKYIISTLCFVQFELPAAHMN